MDHVVPVICPNCDTHLVLINERELNEKQKRLDNAEAVVENLTTTLTRGVEHLKAPITHEKAPTKHGKVGRVFPPIAPKQMGKVGNLLFKHEGTTYKYCSKCRVAKPANTKTFGENLTSKTKLQSWCRECQQSYWKAHKRNRKAAKTARKRSANRAVKYPVVSGKKMCSFCRRWKPVKSSFYKDRIRTDGTVRYKNECKICHNRKRNTNR